MRVLRELYFRLIVVSLCAWAVVGCSDDSNSNDAPTSTRDASDPEDPEDPGPADSGPKDAGTPKPPQAGSDASVRRDAGAPEADGGATPEQPGENEGGTDPLEALPEELALPIVFIHGFAGSAQQFTSQAMRFVEVPSAKSLQRLQVGGFGPLFHDLVEQLLDFELAFFLVSLEPFDL